MTPLDLADIQQLVLHAYRQWPKSRWMFARVDDPHLARNWIGKHIGDVGTATEQNRRAVAEPMVPRVAIALTYPGLLALGLKKPDLEGFGAAFRDGMHKQDHVLGDVGTSAPTGWRWGGDDATVPHLLIVHYASNASALNNQAGPIDPSSGGMRVIHSVGAEWRDREHFGFRDGISEPAIRGSGTSRDHHAGPFQQPLEAGEFVIGHLNESRNYPICPIVPTGRDPKNWLLPEPARPGHSKLGFNGTYLVVRQLEQHVDKWDAFLARETTTLNGQAREDERNRIAAKMVGRWKSGAPLTIASQRDDPQYATENNFGYAAGDASGWGCPLGAHIRRANPRDSDTDGQQRPWPHVLHEANSHRLIRRGRMYEEGGEKGLMFACLNASIENQFEFVQREWIGNSTFHGLAQEDDPVVAGRAYVQNGRFTIQRVGQPQELDGLAPFVSVKGGAYFFLPSIRALRFLAELRDPAG